jgi:hypothetical protein
LITKSSAELAVLQKQASEFSLSANGSSSVDRVYDIPLVGVPAGTDIKFAADTDTNNTGVAGGFEMLLVDV